MDSHRITVILDVLEGGTQPEQVEQAVREALARALTTRARLRSSATSRPATVRNALEKLINAA